MQSYVTEQAEKDTDSLSLCSELQVVLKFYIVNISETPRRRESLGREKGIVALSKQKGMDVPGSGLAHSDCLFMAPIQF